MQVRNLTYVILYGWFEGSIRREQGHFHITQCGDFHKCEWMWSNYFGIEARGILVDRIRFNIFALLKIAR